MSNHRYLEAVDMGIDTHEEPVVYMRKDCDICRAEGFEANTRLLIRHGERNLIATLNTVSESVLPNGGIGFSKSAWRYLGLTAGLEVNISHAPVVQSLSAMRKKIYGNALSETELASIIHDIAERHYSDIEIAAFLTGCAGGRLSLEEIIALTRAMVDSGSRIHWRQYPKVFDKHCVGGLPGNRTTPIVIAIASAAGLTLPKTSSRAITSPAGTADTMEVLTNVDLTLDQMQSVIHQTGACLAWGGRMNLSPVDDLMIRVERALDLDGEGQLVASVLSKKIAAGSTHILIDMPVGPTAKVRDESQARRLADLFHAVGEALDVRVECLTTDGTQTVGDGIGPAEEARDVLAVLRNDPGAPADLRERALLLATHLLVMANGDSYEEAESRTREILETGGAWQQFLRICEAQGGLREIPRAPRQKIFTSERSGRLTTMDNRRLAKLAKLAGAPSSAVAGLRLQAKLGQRLAAGDPLFTLYSDTPGELDYASDFYQSNRDIFEIA
jgi:thymidine phosphorylase